MHPIPTAAFNYAGVGLTDWKAERYPNPEGLCMHPNQLLPDVAEGQEVEGEGDGLVNQHEGNGSLQVGITGHDPIHIPCT